MVQQINCIRNRKEEIIEVIFVCLDTCIYVNIYVHVQAYIYVNK
jgi:hypothetical protein